MEKWGEPGKRVQPEKVEINLAVPNVEKHSDGSHEDARGPASTEGNARRTKPSGHGPFFSEQATGCCGLTVAANRMTVNDSYVSGGVDQFSPKLTFKCVRQQRSET